jgi:predicted DNA-binding protein (MmcQ/YjbR family)
MRTEKIAAFMMEFPETSEEQPFGPNVDVYKVAGKMFAILAPDDTPPAISLKCEPLLAIELRQEFAAVTPGYHLNKTHWNTVVLDGSVPESEIKNMIAHSYDQVVGGLTKAVRERIAATRKPTN